jgi:hypothetical protein
VRTSTSLIALAALLALAAAAVALPRIEARGRRWTHVFDFRDGVQGFEGGFADYPEGEDEFYELAFSEAPLPRSVARNRAALRISGSNHSDDLFMFVKRRIDGLEPGAAYAITFDVKIASNAPRGVAGIGGPPGEGVTLKAGATAIEPLAVATDGFVEMNVDKGIQASGGTDAIVLGHIGVTTDPDRPRYRAKRLCNAGEPFRATADGSGSLWVLVGTDSGYEGVTSLYYTRIALRIVPAAD